MRAALTMAAIVAAAAAVAGCAGLTGVPGANGAGAGAGWAAAAAEIAKDPKCGHDDEVTIILGPISSGTVRLARHCPAPTPTPAAVIAPTP